MTARILPVIEGESISQLGGQDVSRRRREAVGVDRQEGLDDVLRDKRWQFFVRLQETKERWIDDRHVGVEDGLCLLDGDLAVLGDVGQGGRVVGGLTRRGGCCGRGGCRCWRGRGCGTRRGAREDAAQLDQALAGVAQMSPDVRAGVGEVEAGLGRGGVVLDERLSLLAAFVDGAIDAYVSLDEAMVTGDA